MKMVLGKRAWIAVWRIALLGGLGVAFAALTATAGFPLATTAGLPFGEHAVAAKGADATHGADAANGTNATKSASAAKKKQLAPYTVKTVGTSHANQVNTATASCDPGDRATGGGFEGVDLAGTSVIDNSPFTSIDDPSQVDSWSVVYDNGATGDPVTAIVVCADKKPKHS
jgi:hypothetical protein